MSAHHTFQNAVQRVAVGPRALDARSASSLTTKACLVATFVAAAFGATAAHAQSLGVSYSSAPPPGVVAAPLGVSAASIAQARSVQQAPVVIPAIVVGVRQVYTNGTPNDPTGAWAAQRAAQQQVNTAQNIGTVVGGIGGAAVAMSAERHHNFVGGMLASALGGVTGRIIGGAVGQHIANQTMQNQAVQQQASVGTLQASDHITVLTVETRQNTPYGVVTHQYQLPEQAMSVRIGTVVNLVEGPDGRMTVAQVAEPQRRYGM